MILALLAAVILTPAPGPAPRINGPLVYGCRPGHPFLYRIPATGERPMRFSADGLPAGLSLDPATGIITGELAAKGDYPVELHAANDRAASDRPFRIVCGDTLALTPPMGWNDWYCDYTRITDGRVREAADALLRNGMADAGYQYVDIDDAWENRAKPGRNGTDADRVGPARGPDGNILPNRFFPDMKALTDYLHARGFKAGIYSSPGPTTCGGFTGSLRHEAQDARQIADWGFDLLKYDLCSYHRIVNAEGGTKEAFQKPYRLMGRLLREQPRDIVLNLCEYGLGDVWTWGREVGGQSWRTGGDFGPHLDRLFDVALANIAHGEWSAPGSWNDPDYIMLGQIGDYRSAALAHPSPLSPDRQYSYMSLWCLMASPLFYSGEITHVDAFTLGILCNPEVIAVDQDPLGKCAHLIGSVGSTFILAKEMQDGTYAVGFFNRGTTPATAAIHWSGLGWSGSHSVRDLWREKDLGPQPEGYSATVPAGGVVLVNIR